MTSTNQARALVLSRIRAALDRVLDEAERRQDYNTPREREATLAYLRQARDRYLSLASAKRATGK